MRHVERHLHPRIEEALDAFRVVVLHGARQSGKTTMAQRIAQERGGAYVSLDDDATRLAALDDPRSFLISQPVPLIVDEVQLGGDRIVRAIKQIVDDNPNPGQFLLTGSTDFLTVPVISESLAGRARVLRLWPLSEAELAGAPLPGMSRWFSDASVDVPQEFLPRRGYMDRLCRGGYPEAVGLSPDQRDGWFESYIETVVRRDVVELGDIRRASVLTDLLSWGATVTGTELNTEDASRKLGIDRATFQTYLAWMETVFLVQTIPSWSRKLSSRIVRRPKVYMTDTGLAASLLGVSPVALDSPTSPTLGSLVETFVVNEIARQLASEGARLRRHHFRNFNGREIDLVLERPDGSMVGLEIKATSSPSERHIGSLRWLRDQIDSVAPGAFRAGLLLHTGDQFLPVGDRLHMVPISSLWN